MAIWQEESNMTYTSAIIQFDTPGYGGDLIP